MGGGLGSLVPGPTVLKEVAAGVGFFTLPLVDPGWLKIHDLQAGDVQVFMGDHRLIFSGMNDSYRVRQASWAFERKARMAFRVTYWKEN